MKKGGYPREPGAELRVREAAREGSFPQPSPQVDRAETAPATMIGRAGEDMNQRPDKPAHAGCHTHESAGRFDLENSLLGSSGVLFVNGHHVEPVEVSGNVRHHSPGCTMARYDHPRKDGARRPAASGAG
ncbi:hypothetical protein AB0P17_17415 [Streptomyces sp. NPDC088124]|uniref:hypothetical protein n=1 Tax=Streptomyces sp. NPDC088124 TaxID=3154654 RepID=UPI00343B90C4